MKPKSYPILVHAIENGTLRGYQSAFKHKDFPDKTEIIESITTAILNEISEWFLFDDDEI